MHGHNRLLGRSSKLVPGAAGMVMRDTLLTVRGKLVLVPFVMARSLRGRGNAIGPFGGMRQSARPEHQEEHERADQGLPGSHQRRP